MEKRIRSKIEKEYQERTAGAERPEGAVDTTREHVLAHAGPPDEATPVAPPTPAPSAPVVPPVELAVAAPAKAKSRPRVSYV
jgi:hypothetical protein